MHGIVRLPTDVNIQDRDRYRRAIDIWASTDWDEAIKICCNNRDMESLCQFPYIQVLSDIFFRKDRHIFKVEKKE
jgi:hypothetical protein